MATIASRPSTRTEAGSRIRVHVPIWLAVFGSRLIVLAAGICGALFTTRLANWQVYDPNRISSSFGAVGNVLASTSVRWDAIRYLEVAEHGYRTSAQTVSYPLYSLLIRALSWSVLSPVLAGVLISWTAFAVALVLLHRITSEELGRDAANTVVLLLAFAPQSVYFTAVYSESLLLALVVGTFYLARRERFALAAVTAACAALTHVEGVLLVAPLLLMYRRSVQQANPRRFWSRELLMFALPPLALASFFFYLHTQGYGWLAPVTNQNLVNANRESTIPPVMLWDALKAGVSGLVQTAQGVRPVAPILSTPFAGGFQNLIYLGVLLISLGSLFNAWRRLPKEYALYAGLVLIVCLSSRVPGRPLDAFDRYVLPIFPLWMGAAAWLAQRRLTPSVVQVSALLLIFYSIEFTRWVSVA